jgi:hypothetical protein
MMAFSSIGRGSDMLKPIRIALCLIMVISVPTYAHSHKNIDKNHDYTVFHYNVKASKDSNWNDAQCQALLAIPLSYSVNDNIVTYKTSADAQYIYKDYIPTGKTFVNDHTLLFTGNNKMLIKYQGQSMPVLASASFVYDKITHTSTGHSSIPGYCISDFIIINTTVAKGSATQTNAAQGAVTQGSTSKTPAPKNSV